MLTYEIAVGQGKVDADLRAASGRADRARRSRSTLLGPPVQAAALAVLCTWLAGAGLLLADTLVEYDFEGSNMAASVEHPQITADDFDWSGDGTPTTSRATAGAPPLARVTGRRKRARPTTSTSPS